MEATSGDAGREKTERERDSGEIQVRVRERSVQREKGRVRERF